MESFIRNCSIVPGVVADNSMCFVDRTRASTSDPLERDVSRGQP
jgi:hypothetical protein